MVYSGSLDGWYLTEKMADFFASFLKQNREAHLLWLTTGSHDRVRELMRARNVEPDNFSVRAVASARGSFVSGGGGCGAGVYQAMCVEDCVVADEEW